MLVEHVNEIVTGGAFLKEDGCMLAGEIGVVLDTYIVGRQTAYGVLSTAQAIFCRPAGKEYSRALVLVFFQPLECHLDFCVAEMNGVAVGQRVALLRLDAGAIKECPVG